MSVFEQINKTVVLTANTINAGGLIEALRIAVGISTGRVPNKVSVVFCGDGVVHGVIERYNPAFHKYYLAAIAHGVTLYIDEFSLSQRGITSEHVLQELTIVKREELLKLLDEADMHLRI